MEGKDHREGRSPGNQPNSLAWGKVGDAETQEAAPLTWLRAKSPVWSRRPSSHLGSATFMGSYLTSLNLNIFIPQAEIILHASVWRFVYDHKLKSTL